MPGRVHTLVSAVAAIVLALLAVAAPAQAEVQPRIFNGTRVGIASAPWQVLVYSGTISGSQGSLSLCGGSIISTTQIVTAAHCASDVVAAGKVGANPNGGGGLGIAAGISDFKHSAALRWFYGSGTLPAGDAEQDRTVTSARIHPQWANTLDGVSQLPTGDVAVITLTTPLDLSGPAARAVALAPAQPPSADVSLDGVPAYVTGFGNQQPGSSNGLLYNEALQITGRDLCGDGVDTAVNLCGVTPDGTTCHGDSGSGLVIYDPGPVLVGLVSAGPDPCASGNPTFFSSLTAPENGDFVRGSDAPPLAPRQTSAITLAAPSSPRAGAIITCRGGGFEQTSGVTWKFTDDEGAVIYTRTGTAASYALATTDAGHTIGCRAYAVGPGGVATSERVELSVPAVAAPATTSGSTTTDTATGAGGTASDAAASPGSAIAPTTAAPVVVAVPDLGGPAETTPAPQLTLRMVGSALRGHRARLKATVTGLPTAGAALDLAATRIGRTRRSAVPRYRSSLEVEGQTTAVFNFSLAVPADARRGARQLPVTVITHPSGGPTVVLTQTITVKVR